MTRYRLDYAFVTLLFAAAPVPVGYNPGEESPCLRRIIPVRWPETVDQHLLHFGRTGGEESQDEQTACTDQPIRRHQCHRRYEQCHRHIKGMPDPLIGTVRHQRRTGSRDHGVGQVPAEA